MSAKIYSDENVIAGSCSFQMMDTLVRKLRSFSRVSRPSVNRWVRTFLEKGLKGLQEKPRTERLPFLTSEQREQLRQYIKDKANDT